ncbi:MAG: TlpA family protein disulfide reductase [Oligoflexia bacterium]|nr:TlpA family protein disulfide reductase [Oligoflexia bacterium]
MKKLLIALFVVVVMSFSTVLMVNVKAIATEVGDLAPNIVLNDVQTSGDIIKQSILTREQGKKYLLLEFMSINCGPCVGNLPNLQKLNHDSSINALTTIRMISIDRNQRLVMDFLNKYRSQIDYVLSLDLTREALKAYSINATPTTFIVDENNKVIYKHLGSYDDEIMNEIKRVIIND